VNFSYVYDLPRTPFVPLPIYVPVIGAQTFSTVGVEVVNVNGGTPVAELTV
jgi:hypothetical protein